MNKGHTLFPSSLCPEDLPSPALFLGQMVWQILPQVTQARDTQLGGLGDGTPRDR